ncbi:MAG: protein-L-isoaspartate O-methyltransferase [Parcubacteria group bacterium]|nr:protein-L-isoaspartate O-methyltransferase [Parcubacteria group bacterium]|tara:strand:+ start:10171 stop:10782 length:612 start_codon:yes stop_codon:yes gene_type:complete
MKELINELINQGYLKTPAIIDAFSKINRRNFLAANTVNQQSINAPIPIGHGQTNSQPLTVAFMLELLSPQRGQKVLDIGSGSGWTTALLAELVGSEGMVYAVERVAKLKETGQKNVAKYKFSNVHFFCQDGTKGLPDQAPFDRINVAAAVAEIPQELKQQLAINGRMVIPTAAHDIRLIQRSSKDKFKETVYPGFIFVPLIED